MLAGGAGSSERGGGSPQETGEAPEEPGAVRTQQEPSGRFGNARLVVVVTLWSSLQPEDHDRWAAHFDSLQRRRLAPTPAASAPPPGRLNGSERGDWDPSSSLSLAWEASSSCGAESVVGVRVDSTNGFPTRTRYWISSATFFCLTSF